MTSLLPSALGAFGLTALDILAPGAPKRNIGGIIAQVTLDEHGVDKLTITRRPVERGAKISDHAYKEPSEITIRVGWSNSSLAAITGAVTAALGAQSIGSAIGAFTSPSYVSDMYDKMLALQASLIPIVIVTGKRKYSDMMIESLTMTTDQSTENALILTVVCRRVILVQTQTTTVPSAAVQADPKATASPVSQGPVQPAPATNANRGAFNTSAAQDTSTPMFSIPVTPNPLAAAPNTNILSRPL